MIAYEDLILSEPGLVSYWRLDEASGSVLDSKDSNPGTVAGGITRQAAGLLTANADTAISSDGAVGSSISVPDSANLRGMVQATAEFWVQPGERDVYSAQTLLNGHLYIALALDNWYRFSVIDSNGVWTDLYGSYEVTPHAGVTQHVVCVYDAAGSMQIYVNGVLGSGRPNRTPNAVVNNNPAALTFCSDVVEGFSGTLDEVALYNVALTEGQIQLHYRLGSTGNTDLEIIAVEASASAEAPVVTTDPYSPEIIAVEASAWADTGVQGVQIYGGLLSNLHEDFESGTLDQWSVRYGNTVIYESAGRLVIAPSVDRSGGELDSTARYTLDSCSVEVVEDEGSPANWTVGVYSDSPWMDILPDPVASTITFEGGDNNNYYYVTIPYDRVAHRWLRIRLDAGTMLWETSPDGSEWTIQLSQAAWDDGGVNYYAAVENWYWIDGDGNPQYNPVYFDNVNIFPQDAAVTAAPAQAISSAPIPRVVILTTGIMDAELQLDQPYSAYLADAQAYTVDLALE